MSRKKIWLGVSPRICDLCRKAIVDSFVDGKTDFGPWAMMCPSCHNKHGVGLGLGKGQRYQHTASGVWVKTGG